MAASYDPHQAALVTRMATTERELAAEWVKKTMLALKAGSDALAREAMQHSLEHVRAAARYDEELARLEGRPPPVPLAPTDVDKALDDFRTKMGVGKPLRAAKVQSPHGLEALIDALLALDPKRDEN